MRWLDRTTLDRFSGHESEQTPGDSGGQRSLACCGPRGRKEPGPTESEQHQQIFLLAFHLSQLSFAPHSCLALD